MDIEETALLKVFITGGAGFIGSHMAEALVLKGHEVTIFDNFSTGSEGNLTTLRRMKNVRILRGDILDHESLASSMKGADVVSHQAAQLEIGSAISRPTEDARVNIEGTINTLEAAVKNKVRKVVYASSAGIFGEALSTPQDEAHPKRPQWPYGVSKYAGELYCQQYSLFYGLHTCGLRYGIVYGEREWFGRVLTMFIKQVFLDKKPPVVFGDGNQTRDYIYVKDLVEFHNQMVENDYGDIFESYNLGGGKSISIRKLAELIIDLSGTDYEPIFDNPPEGGVSSISGRWRIPRELKNLHLNISKATAMTGWKPKTPFRKGVENEIAWILANPNRWKIKARV
jgi:UDP-glucose 4-epimerase